MKADGSPADATEAWLEGAAAAFTLGVVAFALFNPPGKLVPAVEAPRPTQVTLSVVEEPPPPPPQSAPPPEPAPPPPVLAPSLLPPPPPPRPRRIVHPRRPPPPHPVPLQEAPVQPVDRPPTPSPARTAQQAPQNHSAEAAYVGRLHAIVARNTVLPGGGAYRLSHPSGEVEVGFTLSRAGAVSDVHVIRSSGSALLDRQGIAIVAGQRYPAIPEDAFPGAPTHGFSVPVSFPDSGAADGL